MYRMRKKLQEAKKGTNYNKNRVAPNNQTSEEVQENN